MRRQIDQIAVVRRIGRRLSGRFVGAFTHTHAHTNAHLHTHATRSRTHIQSPGQFAGEPCSFENHISAETSAAVIFIPRKTMRYEQRSRLMLCNAMSNDFHTTA